MRLLNRVGERCLFLLDTHMRGFHSQRLQVDEIWTFVRKKEALLTEQERQTREAGDQYVFVALDAETKLAPTFAVGKRDRETALGFLTDLRRRLNGDGESS